MQNQFKSADRILPERLHPWMDENSRIYQRLSSWASGQNIEFCFRYLDEQIIKNSKTEKILWVLIFDLIPSVDTWKHLDLVCEEHGRKIWFVTDNLIDEEHYRFDNIKIKSYHQLLGTTHYKEFAHSQKNPQKLFNCFIQRVESIRQSWFYFLYLNDLLDRGHVSLLLWQTPDHPCREGGVKLFDHNHYTHGLDQLSHFDRAYKELRSLMPYRNFDHEDLLSLINDSKYSLILETYGHCDGAHAWCFTEKLLRSLQISTINLPFVAKHGIRELRKLGLILDENIDAIDSMIWQERQKALLEILVKDSIEFDPKKILAQSTHNRSLIGQWKQDYQKSDFFDDLFEEILEK